MAKVYQPPAQRLTCEPCKQLKYRRFFNSATILQRHLLQASTTHFSFVKIKRLSSQGLSLEPDNSIDLIQRLELDFRILTIVILNFWMLILASCEDADIRAQNTPPGSDTEEIDGYIAESTESLTANQSKRITIGTSSIFFPEDSVNTDAEVQLKILREIPNRDELIELGEAKSEIIEITMFQKNTQKIFDSDVFDLPYQMSQRLEEIENAKDLKYVIYSNPGTADEKIHTLSQNALKIDDTALLLSSIQVTIDLKLTHAIVYAVELEKVPSKTIVIENSEEITSFGGGVVQSEGSEIIAGISSASLALHLDADRAQQDGTSGYGKTCEGDMGIWYDLSEDKIQGNSFNTVICKDRTGWQGDGTTTNPYRFVLDGEDDYIEIAHDGFNYSANDPFSVMAWIRTTSQNAGSIFSKMGGAPEYRGYDLFFCGSNANGCSNGGVKAHLSSDWGIAYDADAISLYSNAPINDGSWHLVAMVYDGSMKAQGMKIYIDGALATVTVEYDKLEGSVQNSAKPIIGTRAPWSYDGDIASLILYERALGASEIIAYCRDTQAKFSSDEGICSE